MKTNKRNYKLKKNLTKYKNKKRVTRNKIKNLKKRISKKIKGGDNYFDKPINYVKGNVQNLSEYSQIFKYTIKRLSATGIGYMDLYIDRFIARNQDFSSLMNQKFVEDMDVRNNLLVYATTINYAFNDSYNIPFTEPILFELFDMCKFRIKKLFTIPLSINIDLLLNKNETSINNNNEITQNIEKNINPIKKTIVLSPRFELFVYFFKQFKEILSSGNNLLKNEDLSRNQENQFINRIEENSINNNEINNNNDSQLKKVEKLAENDNSELKNIIDDNKVEPNNLTNEEIEIDNIINKTNDISLNNKEEIDNKLDKAIEETNKINRIDDDGEDDKNKLEKAKEFISDYTNFTTKTKILSKLNKYIFIEDLIYENQLNNITPFYTKKEAIIYSCRLLLNNDVTIDLYNDTILYENINNILKNNNISSDNYSDIYLDNNKVYKFLDKYINITRFDKNTPVYFSDILYKKSRIANRIDDDSYNNSNDFNQLHIETNDILNKQKEIIDKLLYIIENKINNKIIALNSLEYSFIISYKLMIENRKSIIEKKIGDNDKKLAEELYKFKNLIPELGAKISHYGCSSPTNMLSIFIKSLVFLPIAGPISIGYLALNCIISGLTFFTILYIFRN